MLTFGSNQHGQLGHGTRSLRGAPGPLQGIPSGMRAVQVAAGSNHTVLLLANGAVYTCGNPLVSNKCFNIGLKHDDKRLVYLSGPG